MQILAAAVAISGLSPWLSVPSALNLLPRLNTVTTENTEDIEPLPLIFLDVWRVE
jgi:hypothetical protein